MSKVRRNTPLEQKRKCSITKVQRIANEFESRARSIHGDKYDYSKFEYTGTHNQSIVICKEHGEFKVTPNEHLYGKNGCPICANIARRKFLDSLKSTDWKEKATEVHDGKYDYSKFEYINTKTKSIIICPIHGEFLKDMAHHINRKQGCPICAKERNGSIGEITIRNFLIENNIKFTEQFIIKGNDYLKNKPYDFYLEDLNLIIEFQGEQHFKTKWFMDEEDLLLRQEIDRNKKELAISNNYKYISIKYNDDILKVLSSTTIESK